MTIEIIILVILIMLSGFFSGIETALMSISNVKVRQLFDNKKKGSSQLKDLKDRPHRLIITLLLGNNVVNIGASAIATSIAIQSFGNMGVGIATGFMTLIILIFGEICPKGIAVNNADKIALMTSPIVLFLRKALTPLVWLLDGLTKSMVALFSKNSAEPLVTEEELRDIVTIGEKEGSINLHEKTMIDNIFELNDTKVEEIMIPRIDMFALDAEMTIKEVLPEFMEEGYSRVPIFEETVDKIVGYINVSDLFKAVIKKDENKKLKEVSKDVKFIPETKKVDELLREFQREKSHLAVVIDEFGGVSGIITIEDLLEEIVGEIYDEDEQKEHPIVRKGKSEFIIKGDTELDDVISTVKIKSEYPKDINTIGGLIFERLGKIPEEGEKLELVDADIIITKMEDNRIQEIKLIKRP